MGKKDKELANLADDELLDRATTHRLMAQNSKKSAKWPVTIGWELSIIAISVVFYVQDAESRYLPYAYGAATASAVLFVAGFWLLARHHNRRADSLLRLRHQAWQARQKKL